METFWIVVISLIMHRNGGTFNDKAYEVFKSSNEAVSYVEGDRYGEFRIYRMGEFPQEKTYEIYKVSASKKIKLTRKLIVEESK